MDPTPDLKRDLSMLLDQELGKQLLPGERVLVSLPGSFGEAFVVTDRRAVVLREKDSGPGCDIHAYPMASVSGAEAAASGTGGYIEVKLAEPPAEPDLARVYFPTYDLERFQKAAEFVKQMLSSVAAAASSLQAPPSSRQGSIPGGMGGGACPQCGAALDPESAFCAQCGAQARVICSECGASSPRGGKYCRYCGRSIQEMDPTCRKCGARVVRGMTFCTECGSVLQESCANCGGRVVDVWKFCAYCGRQLGTGYVNPRTAVARHIQSRIGEAQQAEQQTDQLPSAMAPSPPQVQTGPAAPDDASRTAEQHNQRGRELFDSEDLQGAIREFQAAVQLDPGNASYHSNLAVAYDENEQDAEALAEYENALRLDPNDVATLLCLGYMYNENEEADKARDAWNRILEIAPDSAEAQEARSNLDSMKQL